MSNDSFVGDRSLRWRLRLVVTVTAVAALAVGGLALAAAQGTKEKEPAYTGDRAETERFIAYDKAITLTPEQEAVRKAALEALPAPCCSQFTAATCCCPCSMARATWGLAKHLIVDEGKNAEEVKTEVAAWHHAINPDGFSGDVCFTGGCGRPFAKNGCGGMKELTF